MKPATAHGLKIKTKKCKTKLFLSRLYYIAIKMTECVCACMSTHTYTHMGEGREGSEVAL